MWHCGALSNDENGGCQSLVFLKGGGYPVAKKDEQGFILIWTLLMVMLLMALGMALLLLARQNVQMSQFYKERQKAFYAAESGLNMALALLAAEDALVPFAREGELNGASYQVTAEPSPGGVRLISRGVAGGRSVSLTAELARNVLFPRNLVEIGSDPSYSPREFTVSDKFPPPVESSGSIIFSYEEKVVENTWTIDATEHPVEVYIAGDLTFKGRGGLEITGDNRVDFYILGSVKFNGNRKCTVTPGGDWTVFWVRNALDFKGNVEIGNYDVNTDDARVVFLMDTSVTGQSVDIGGNPKIAAGIYAGSRTVQFRGKSVRIDGSVVGNILEFHPALSSDDERFRMDRHLTEFGSGGGLWVPVPGSWREN